MSLAIGIIMDPIESINPAKDTTFAIMLAAQARGHTIYYLQSKDVWLQDGLTWGSMQAIRVADNLTDWFELSAPVTQPLVELDLVFMRKDPPFNMQYIYTTYLLEQAQAKGLRVINDPKSLRDANEKLFTAWFPQCCPKTLVTSQASLLKDFIAQEQDIVIKPLDGMGGRSIFRVTPDNANINVIIETVTENGASLVMAQRYIPEIRQGDKRILLINGKPIGYALARIPSENDFRGNLAAGATGVGQELSEHDLWICEQVGPTLREKGLVFVGLDVVGDYLTEINVTSPTCIRELDKAFNLDIAQDLLREIESGC